MPLKFISESLIISLWTAFRKFVGIVYDAAKEEKTAWNAKQKKLAEFEESKKREDEKGLQLLLYLMKLFL